MQVWGKKKLSMVGRFILVTSALRTLDNSWGVLASQPNLLGLSRATERPSLKKQNKKSTWGTTSEVSSGFCIGYFSVALIKYHDQGNLKEERLTLFYWSGEIVCMMAVRHSSKQAWWQEQHPRTYDILLPARFYHLTLPKQTARPPGDQMFKYLGLCGTFLI